MRSSGTSPSGSASPYGLYPGAPAGIPARPAFNSPAGGLTPNAPAGTPLLTPNAPAGTPAGTSTPNPGVISPRNQRASFFGAQAAITGQAVLENLGARLERESAAGRMAAIELGSKSLEKLIGVYGDYEAEECEKLKDQPEESAEKIDPQEFAEYEKLKDQSEELAETIAEFVLGGTFNPAMYENDERLKAVAKFDLGFLGNDDARKSVRKQALFKMSDKIAQQEFAKYEKLKDQPEELAEKIAQLVFGSTMDPSLDENNERLKSLFELGFLDKDDDRKSVRDKAFREVKMLDGGGVMGLTGHESIGTASLLEPESRSRLSTATKCILNMLEHGQWVPHALSPKTSEAASRERTAEPRGTPSQLVAGHDDGTTGLPSISVTASADNRETSPSALARDNKRSPSPNPLQEGVDRGKGRLRES